MKNKAKQTALCAFMCALATIIMALGSIIPAATFCSPALAMLALIPVQEECGTKQGILVYAATSVLSLLLVPDKEIVMLYLFLGYYPLVKLYLDRIRNRVVQVLAKFILLNVTIFLMYALCIFLFRLDSVVQEYQQATAAIVVMLCVLGNFAFFIYDLLLGRLRVLYRQKASHKWFK